MTLKEVSSVIDDINEWENPRGGSVFYVTAIFTDESVGSVGRKDHDAALEVQGLLRESIGIEQDFTLEPAGSTKTGREKFKIKGFGTPGGAATYTAPGIQGNGGSQPQTGERQHRSGRSPEHDVDASIEDPRRSKLEMRATEALQAAALASSDPNEVLGIAELYDTWLAKKASEPASSAYEGGGTDTALPAGSPPKAGVGSEDREEGVESEGKEPAPSSHIHDYQIRQGVKGFLVCECGKTTKKASE